MKHEPIIAVVGRPNVGKSTLFNRLTRQRKAIVHNQPGITRDRIYHPVELFPGCMVRLVDTGGLEPSTDDYILSQMRTQSLAAVMEADVIVLLVDATEGITAMDEEVADVVRRSGKPVVLAVNKVDVKGAVHGIHDFYSLGFEQMIPISSAHGDGMDRLRHAIADALGLDPDQPPATDRQEAETPESRPVHISIIGKPNVGKSSLLNRLLGEDRALVSDLPGTTRDPVDADIRYHGRTFRFVDTAGIRRRAKVKEFVEKISVVQAQKNIERSDVVLMLVDSSQDASLQDANISGYAHNHYKNVIILFNKWDLVEKDTRTVKKYEEQLRQKMKFLKYAPILFISAKTGQRVNRIFPLIESLLATGSRRIPTAALNRFLEDAVQKHRPPAERGRHYKFYYMTQTGTLPQTFTVFTNSSNPPHFSYVRYLENGIRDTFDLQTVPIRLQFKPRPRRERKSGGARS